MKQVLFFLLTAIVFASCGSSVQITGRQLHDFGNNDTLITQSLFNDKSATISEENIQQILNGNYQLPQQLRVAVVRINNSAERRYSWNDEEYLKTQQAYLDLFTTKLKQSNRVTKVLNIPDLLISKTPSFTSIREAAVRLQADIVIVYAINSDLYAKNKLFSPDDLKAFATTQLLLLDVRTGLVPFSTIVTKDFLSQKTKEETNTWEARKRVQKEAVQLTIDEVGLQLGSFFDTK